MGPINYNLSVQSPLQKVLAVQKMNQDQANTNRSFAQRDRQLALQRTGQDQNYRLQDRRVTLAETESARRQQAVQAKIDAATAQKQALTDFAAKPNKTAKDYSEMIAANPEIAQELKQSYDIMGEDAQKQSTTEAAQIYGALSSGNTDVANKILERRITAAKNSGDDAQYQSAKALKDVIAQSPEAGRTTAGLYLASVTDGSDFAYTLGALDKIDPEAKKLAAQDKAEARKFARNREDRAQKKFDADVKREMIKETREAKKQGVPRTTTTAEMQSMFAYGEDIDLTKQQVSEVAGRTRGKSIEERLAALDEMAAGGSTDKPAQTQTKAADPKSFFSQAAPSQYEGKTVTGPNGEEYTAKNGKWIKEK